MADNAVRKTVRVTQELLAVPVRGLNLQAGTLGDELGTGPTLLCFLRHFG